MTSSKEKYKRRVEKAKGKALGDKSYVQIPKIKGGKVMPVRIPVVNLPHLLYGPRRPGSGSSPDVGSGPGNPGDPLYPPQGEDDNEAGDEPMDSIYDPTEKQELILKMKYELELEFLKPGKEKIIASLQFPAIVEHGDPSLLDLDSTVYAMLQRQLLEFIYSREQKLKPIKTLESLCFEMPLDYIYNSFYEDKEKAELLKFLNPDLNLVKLLHTSPSIPINIKINEQDFRYLLPRDSFKKEMNATVVFIRDVSGSISEEELRLSYEATLLTKWWLEEFYNNVAVVYVAHNAQAWEETEHGYFNLSSGGGTAFTPAYEIINSMIKGEDYPKKTDNRRKIDINTTDLYIMQMTDGQSFSNEADAIYLKNELLQHVTRLCYYEMDFAGFGSGQFSSDLDGIIDYKPIIRIHRSTTPQEGVWEALKTFFGKKNKQKR